MTLEDLQARPTFEQGRVEYVGMLNEIRLALSEITPTLRWAGTTARLRSVSGCGPSTDSYRGVKANYSAGGAQGGIPPESWPTAVAAVQRIAVAHGFTAGAVPVNAPSGNRRHVFRHPWDATLEMGSFKGTFVTLYAPCLYYAGNTWPTVDPEPSSEPSATT